MNDVIQYQRLASGYVPGLGEIGGFVTAPPASTPNFTNPGPTTAKLQNCIVTRPVAAGIFDVIVGASGPFPTGVGGTLEPAPPLANAAIICQGARVRVTPRTRLPNPVVAPVTAAANADVTWSVFCGASLGATPLYTGINNDQVFRIIFTTSLAQAAGVFVLTDCDFDFTVERVIDPSQEP